MGGLFDAVCSSPYLCVLFECFLAAFYWAVEFCYWLSLLSAASYCAICFPTLCLCLVDLSVGKRLVASQFSLRAPPPRLTRMTSRRSLPTDADQTKNTRRFFHSDSEPLVICKCRYIRSKAPAKTKRTFSRRQMALVGSWY